MIIYILKLENNKYYVGKTHNLDKRLHFHKNNLGSEWTKKYKYKYIIETFNSDSAFDEDKYVKIYMNKYGIDNVRGGSYNQIKLSQEQKNNLIKELQTVKNVCYRCGRNNHFIKNCYAKTDINGNNLLTNIHKEDDLSFSNIMNDFVSISKDIYRFFRYSK